MHEPNPDELIKLVDKGYELNILAAPTNHEDDVLARSIFTILDHINVTTVYIPSTIFIPWADKNAPLTNLYCYGVKLVRCWSLNDGGVVLKYYKDKGGYLPVGYPYLIIGLNEKNGSVMLGAVSS